MEDKNNSMEDQKYMTVREMGDLLGLKKTDRYWLIHKGYFQTKVMGGRTYVDVESFERWYANQIKYHKVSGEEPGREVNERTYSIRELAEMFEVHEPRSMRGSSAMNGKPSWSADGCASRRNRSSGGTPARPT